MAGQSGVYPAGFIPNYQQGGPSSQPINTGGVYPNQGASSGLQTPSALTLGQNPSHAGGDGSSGQTSSGSTDDFGSGQGEYKRLK